MDKMIVSGFSSDWPKKAAWAPLFLVFRMAVRKAWIMDVVGDEASERSAGEASSKVAVSVIILGMVVVVVVAENGGR